MQSAKSKASLPETPPNNKVTPASPKVSQLPRARSTKSDSKSPSTLQKRKKSIERSPKSVNSKSINGYLVSKTSNRDKQERGTKGSSELHRQLDFVQDELKKTNERLTSDAKALASAKEEIEILKSELAMAVEAKNTAMDHANNAKKIAEANAAKSERVSAEVSRLRNLLNSRIELMDSDCSAELVRKLEAEVELLKHELNKVDQMEEIIEDLKIEISDAKRAESEACAEVDELKKKVESLEIHVDEANRAVSAMKEKLESLRVELARKSSDMEESDRQLEILKSELEMAKRETMEMEILKSELKSLEEKDKLVLEFETANAEREKLKKEMEDAKERNFVEVVKKTKEEIADLEGSDEGLKFRERMVQENNDLRTRVEELTSLLEEVKSKEVTENGNGSGGITEEELVEVDAKDSGSFEKINELPSESMENGGNKKRNLFKFGGLLTKKSYK